MAPRVLTHLHSVLIVPESVNDEIRLLHPSFHDFLTSPERCLDPRLYINPPENHAHLAEGCFHILLKELKHDPCQVGNPWLSNPEISHLPDRVQESISSHLQYACRHYAFHLSQVPSTNNTLADLLAAFCNSQLLTWVETVSLLAEVDNAVLSLQILRDWYQVRTLVFTLIRWLMEVGTAYPTSY